MSHDLFAVFPLPVILAFAASILLLLAIVRVLAEMSKPVPVRDPLPKGVESEGLAFGDAP